MAGDILRSDTTEHPCRVVGGGGVGGRSEETEGGAGVITGHAFKLIQFSSEIDLRGSG